MKRVVSRKSSHSGKTSKAFPIVAVGASAGGLDAITQLLQNLKSNTGLAFNYIQHLSPDHKSILSSILTKATLMKVQEAKNNMLIKINNLYIIPPLTKKWC